MALDVAAHLTLAVDGDATVFPIMMVVKLGTEVSRGDTQPLAHEVQPAHEQPMAHAPLMMRIVQTTHELVLESVSALQVVDDPPGGGVLMTAMMSWSTLGRHCSAADGEAPSGGGLLRSWRTTTKVA
jgi:hypothetical protein